LTQRLSGLLDTIVRDLEAGRWAAARDAAERLLEAHPEEPRALQCLGLAEYFAGNLPAAVRALQRAASLAPEDGDCQARLGLALQESLDFAGAIVAHERALAQDPDDASALNNLGLCHWNLGCSDLAVAAYRKAIDIAPRFAEPHFNLGLALAGRLELDQAREILERAQALQPDRPDTRLYLAAVLTEAGRHDEAKVHLDALREAQGSDHWLPDSWDHALRHREPASPLLWDGPRALLNHALDCAALEGLVMEFGVAHGNTINVLAERADQLVHGFDAFEGLPERWGDLPAGAYSLDGRLPEVRENVELHVGWFEDTLPEFLEGNREPLRLANVDCDLYGSTHTVLQALGERVRPGSVLVFDEYFMGQDWRDHEYRAFREAATTFGWRYRYRALSVLTRQAVIEVIAVEPAPGRSSR
jgi:Flp pilus assembly protein TadD